MTAGKRLLALGLAVLLAVPGTAGSTARAAEPGADVAVTDAAETVQETVFEADSAAGDIDSGESPHEEDAPVEPVVTAAGEDVALSTEEADSYEEAALVTTITVDPLALATALGRNYSYDAVTDAVVVPYIHAFDQKSTIQAAVRNQANNVVTISVDGTDLGTKANALYLRKLGEITFSWDSGTEEFTAAGSYTLTVTLPAAAGENGEAKATLKLDVVRTELEMDATRAYIVANYAGAKSIVRVSDVLEAANTRRMTGTATNGVTLIYKNAGADVDVDPLSVLDTTKKPYVTLYGSEEALPEDTVLEAAKAYVLHHNVALASGMEAKWSIDNIVQTHNLIFTAPMATEVEVTYLEDAFSKPYDGMPFVLTPSVKVYALGDDGYKKDITPDEESGIVVSKWYRAGGNTGTFTAASCLTNTSGFRRYSIWELEARYQSLTDAEIVEAGTYYHVTWFLDVSGSYHQSFFAQRVTIEANQAIVMPVFDNGNSEAPVVIDETVTSREARAITVYSGQTVQSVLDRIGYKAFETTDGATPDPLKIFPEDAFGTAYDADLTGASTQLYRPVFAIQKKVDVAANDRGAAYTRWIDADENGNGLYYDEFIESGETYRVVFTGDKAVYSYRINVPVNGTTVDGYFETERIAINGADARYRVITTEDIKDAWAITLIPADKQTGEIDVTDIISGAAEAGFTAAAGTFESPLSKDYKWNGGDGTTPGTGAEPIYATREAYKKAKLSYYDVTVTASPAQASVTAAKHEVTDIAGTDERFEYTWYKLDDEDRVLTQLLDKAREINADADTLVLTAPAEGADAKTKQVYEEWEAILDAATWSTVNGVLNDIDVNANNNGEDVDKDKAVAPFDAGVYRLGVKFNPETMDDFKYDAPEAFVYYVVNRAWAVAAIEPDSGMQIYSDGGVRANAVLTGLQTTDSTRTDSYISSVRFYEADANGNRSAELKQPARVNILRDLLLRTNDTKTTAFEIDMLKDNELIPVANNSNLSEKDPEGNANSYRLNLRRIPDYTEFAADSIGDYRFWTEDEKLTYPKLSNYNFGRAIGKHGEDLSAVKYPNVVIPVNVIYSDMIAAAITVDENAVGLEKVYDGADIDLSEFIENFVHVTRTDSGEELQDAKAKLHVTLVRDTGVADYPDPFILPSDLATNTATTYTAPTYIMDSSTKRVTGATHGGTYEISIVLEADATYKKAEYTAAAGAQKKKYTITRRELELVPTFKTSNELILSNGMTAEIPGIPAGIQATDANIAAYVIDDVTISQVMSDVDTGLIAEDQAAADHIIRAFEFAAQKTDEVTKDGTTQKNISYGANTWLKSAETYLVRADVRGANTAGIADDEWYFREDAYLTAYNGGTAEKSGIPTQVSYGTDYCITDRVDTASQTFIPVNAPAVVEEFQTGGVDEVTLNDSITGVKDEITGIVTYTHLITASEGIPVDYAGTKSPLRDTLGKNVFRFELHAPEELSFAGDQILTGQQFMAAYTYREAIETAGGWVGTNATPWNYQPSAGAIATGTTPHITVSFLSRDPEEEINAYYDFQVDWGAYIEKYTVDLTEAGNDDDLTKAVAPKSLKFGSVTKKMAVGDTQQLDVKITKRQKADIILLGYRIADGGDYMSITDEETERMVTSLTAGGAGATAADRLPAGIVTALATDEGKSVKVKVEAYAAYYDAYGVKQPILNKNGKEAKVAKLTLTVTEVEKPKIAKIIPGDETITVRYNKPATGMRREVYILKGSKIKAEKFEELIASVNNGRYDQVFDYSQIFGISNNDETTGDAAREKPSVEKVRVFTTDPKMGRLDPNETYTIYIRNVSGLRTVNDGDKVADSHAGTVKTFKTSKSLVNGLDLSLEAAAVEYDWTDADTYVPNAMDNSKLGDHPYYDYSVKLSDKTVQALTLGKFSDRAQNAAADEGDFFLASIKPMSAELKNIYQMPKLNYIITDTLVMNNTYNGIAVALAQDEFSNLSYAPGLDTFKRDVDKNDWKSFVRVKLADGTVRYYHKAADIATVNKTGKIKLKGKGHVWIIVIDTLSGATDQTLLFIDADPTDVKAKKVNINVNESVTISSLLKYSEGKTKIVGYESEYKYFNPVTVAMDRGHFYDLSFTAIDTEDFLIEQIPDLTGAVNCPVYGDVRHDVRVTALKPGAKLNLQITDSSGTVPFTQTVKLTSKPVKVQPVKGLKVLAVADDRATFGFTYAGDLTAAGNEAVIRMIVKDKDGKVYTDEIINNAGFEFHRAGDVMAGATALVKTEDVSLNDAKFDGFRFAGGPVGNWWENTARRQGKTYAYAVSYVPDSAVTAADAYIPNNRDALTRLSNYTVTIIVERNGVQSKAVSRKFKTTDIPASYRNVIKGTDRIFQYGVDGRGVDGGIRVTTGTVQQDRGTNYPQLGVRTLRSGNSYTLYMPLTATITGTTTPNTADNISARLRKTDKLTWKSTNTKVASVKAKAGTFEATLTAKAPGETQIYVISRVTKQVIASCDVTVAAVGDAAAYFGDNETYERTAAFIVSVLDETPAKDNRTSASEIVGVGLNSPFNEPAAGVTNWYSFTAPGFGNYSLQYNNAAVGGFTGITMEKGQIRYFSITGVGGAGTFRVVGDMYNELPVGRWTGTTDTGVFTAVGEGENVFFTAPEDGLYEVIYSYKDGHSAKKFRSDAVNAANGNQVGYMAKAKGSRETFTIPEGVKSVKVTQFNWIDYKDGSSYTFSSASEVQWFRFTADEDGRYRLRFDVESEDEEALVSAIAYYGTDSTRLNAIAAKLNDMGQNEEAVLGEGEFKNKDAVMITLGGTNGARAVKASAAGQAFPLVSDAGYTDGESSHVYIGVQYANPEKVTKPVVLKASVLTDRIDTETLTVSSSDTAAGTISATLYTPTIYAFTPKTTGVYLIDYETADNDTNAPAGVSLGLYESTSYPALTTGNMAAGSWSVMYGKASNQTEYTLEAGKKYYFVFGAVAPAADNATDEEKAKQIAATLSIKMREIKEIGLTALAGNTVTMTEAGRSEYRYFRAPETNVYTFTMVRSAAEDAKNLGRANIWYMRGSVSAVATAAAGDVMQATDPAAEVITRQATLALKEGETVYFKITSVQRTDTADAEKNDIYNRTIRVEKRSVTELPNTINLAKSETKYFVFRSTGKDVYRFRFSRVDEVDKDSTVRWSKDKNPYTLTNDLDNGTKNNLKAKTDPVQIFDPGEFTLGADDKVYFQITNESDTDAEEISVNVIKREPVDFTAASASKTLTTSNQDLGAWFRFKPTEAGYYKINFTASEDREFGVIRYQENTVNSYPDITATTAGWSGAYVADDKSAFNREVYLKSDRAYYFKVNLTAALTGTETVSITATATPYNTEELKVGSTYTATADRPFLLLSYAAEEANTYSFGFTKDPQAGTMIGNAAAYNIKYEYLRKKDNTEQNAIVATSKTTDDTTTYTYGIETVSVGQKMILYIPVSYTAGFDETNKEIKVKLEEVYKPQLLTLNVPGTTTVKVAKGEQAKLSRTLTADEADFYALSITASDEKNHNAVGELYLTGINAGSWTSDGNGIYRTGYHEWTAGTKAISIANDTSDGEVTFTIVVTRRVITPLTDGQTVTVAKNTQQWFSYQVDALNNYTFTLTDATETNKFKVVTKTSKADAVAYGSGSTTYTGSYKPNAVQMEAGAVRYFVIDSGVNDESKATDLSLTFKVKAGETDTLADGKEYTVNKGEKKLLTWTVDKDDLYVITLTDTMNNNLSASYINGSGTATTIALTKETVTEDDKITYVSTSNAVALKAGYQVRVTLPALDEEDHKVSASIESYWKDAVEIKNGNAFSVAKMSDTDTGTVYRIYKYEATDAGVFDIVFTGEKGVDEALAGAIGYENDPLNRSSFTSKTANGTQITPEGSDKEEDKYYTYTFNDVRLNKGDVVYFRAQAPANDKESIVLTPSVKVIENSAELSSTIGNPLTLKKTVDKKEEDMIYTWTNTSDSDVLVRIDATGAGKLEVTDADGKDLGNKTAWENGTTDHAFPVKAGETAFLKPSAAGITVNSINTESLFSLGSNSFTIPVGTAIKVYYMKNAEGMAGAGYFSATPSTDAVTNVLFNNTQVWNAGTLTANGIAGVLLGSDNEFVRIEVTGAANERITGKLTITKQTGALISDTAENKQKHLYANAVNYIRVENSSYATAMYNLTYTFENGQTKTLTTGTIIRADGKTVANQAATVKMGEAIIFAINNTAKAAAGTDPEVSGRAYQTRLTVKKTN